MSNRPKLRILRTGADDSAEINTDEMRPLLHVHIPKCAGTSLDHILIALAQAWGRPGIRFLGTIYGQGFSGLEKKEAWKQAEGINYPNNWLYASGHIPFGRFPYYEAAPNKVSIIRDPVSRLVSMFRMGIKRGAWGATTPVKELFESGLLAADSMVRQLSGETSMDKELDSRHVETALRNFESMKYTGRIEDFDHVLGSILADYKIPYVAYHSYQVGETVDDFEFERLGEALAPYMELDQVLFDRIDGNSRSSYQAKAVSIGDIAPSAPVLLVSRYRVSKDGRPIGSPFLAAESLAKIVDC